jgi:hypothetical protein
MVRGRCRATNLCDYCARLAAVETAEMLALDALEGSAPQLWLVLTTRTADVDPSRFYRSREKVWKAIRRRWPDAEYVGLVEFTTGYGLRSGGERRPHWNLLVKGVPVEAEAELRELVRRVWCSREDAEPWAQFVGPVSEVGGLMRYLALHFLKESQAPPRGWRGHRVVASRGYFALGRAEARARARRALRLKRLLWQGLELDEAEAELARRELERWELRAGAPVSWLTVERREGVVPAAEPAADLPARLAPAACPQGRRARVGRDGPRARAP